MGVKTRTPTRRRALGVVLLALVLGAVASPTGATTLFFDGPVDGGVNLGTTPPVPVPVIQPDLFLTTGTLDVISRSADGTVLPADPGTNFEIESSWVVKNVSGADIIGETYLFFPSAANRSVTTSQGTFDTTYPVYDPTGSDPPALGLTVDAARGWVVAQTSDVGLGDLFYAGILLKSGTFAADEEVTIDVTYFLTDPQLFPDIGSDLVLGLPELRLLLGFIVPEPGTGLLVGLGLLVLGGRRRR